MKQYVLLKKLRRERKNTVLLVLREKMILRKIRSWGEVCFIALGKGRDSPSFICTVF